MRVLFAIAILAAAFGAPAALVAQQPPAAASQEYVPVDPSTAREQLPAAPLVMAAYAIVWIVVVLYLWSIWRRLSAVQREIAQVSRRIEAGGRR